MLTETTKCNYFLKEYKSEKTSEINLGTITSQCLQSAHMYYRQLPWEESGGGTGTLARKRSTDYITNNYNRTDAVETERGRRTRAQLLSWSPYCIARKTKLCFVEGT